MPALSDVESFFDQYPDIQTVDLLISDTNGIVRGKRVNREGCLKAFSDGVCLPGSLFGARITGDTVEETGLGFDEGDADRICRPLLHTLQPVPWQPTPSAQVLMSMYEPDGTPFFADPRHVLAHVLQRFDSLGLTPVVAVELEFYLIDQQRTEHGSPQPPRSPATGEREHSTQVYGISELDDYGVWLADLQQAALAQQIPADTAVAEYAPGQYEINLGHQPDALLACDQAVMLKRLIKGVTRQHGMEATFMAKPYDDLAGNGLHVHVSLLDRQGENIFISDDPLSHPPLRHAIGGLAETVSGAMALFAPNVNSYRRFQVDSYVPLSPTWGYNNRTLALRIPSGPVEARRVEHRVAGADANVYLTVAAVLAGIHHGLNCQTDPGPPVEGNAYLQQQPSLPDTWLAALTEFERSAFIGEYFDPQFRQAYFANKTNERTLFMRHVTALEHQWYLRTV